MARTQIHFDNYVNLLEQIVPGISNSIKATVNDLVPTHILNFSYREHLTGLLLGNIQSGKTSQLFGIITAVADEGFPIFLLLTSDNIKLQEQTYQRALQTLTTLNVCGEDDDISFFQYGLKKPTLVILKKNTNVLRTWKNHIASSKFCQARPLFIIDDEADNASLNTLVNKNEQSTINKHLDEIKNLASSSIYLQVTATPQAVLLQSKLSGWKPSFIHYFPPGPGYLGGDFFYPDQGSFAIRVTDDELEDLKDESDYISEGLRQATLSFLVASAHIFLNKGSVCNFLIHPSIRIKDHESVADKIAGFLNTLLYGDPKTEIFPQIEEAWRDLQQTKPDIKPLLDVKKFVSDALQNMDIKILVMNSKSDHDINKDTGMNIIIGGNSLGRGVTFPALQTVYYTRRSRTPQADTFWQHCRMFGYDRDPNLMRIYLPGFLLKMFTGLNSSNSALLNQVADTDLDDISLLYPKGISPTRKNVIDNDTLNIIVGGVDMFSSYPAKTNVAVIDSLVDDLDDSIGSVNEVSLDFIMELLDLLGTENDADWDNQIFLNCMNTLIAEKKESDGIVIVRKERDLKRFPRTMLSPDDRKLGRTFPSKTVLTIYRIKGEGKGWQSDPGPRWMSNIRLPEGINFYNSDD